MSNDYECIEYIAPDLQKKPEEIELVKAAIRIDDKVYTGWRHAKIFHFIIVPPENPLALADGMNGGLLNLDFLKVRDIISLVH